MPQSERGPTPVQVPNADSVAAVVARAVTIDAAAESLTGVGWQSRVAGNRINVANRVFARFIDDQPGRPTWVVYGIGDKPPVRIVVANHQADQWGEVR